MLLTLDFHKSFQWRDVFGEMLDGGLEAHDLGDNVGFHVHFNRNFLTVVEMTKLDFYLHLNKEQFEKIARRKEVNFAGYKKFDGDIKKFGKGDDRFQSVNFTNTNTVEIRIFRSTLRYETVIATLEIVDGLVRFVKTLNAAALIGCNGRCWRLFENFLNVNKERYSFALDYFVRCGVSREERKEEYVCGSI